MLGGAPLGVMQTTSMLNYWYDTEENNVHMELELIFMTSLFIMAIYFLDLVYVEIYLASLIYFYFCIRNFPLDFIWVLTPCDVSNPQWYIYYLKLKPKNSASN